MKKESKLHEPQIEKLIRKILMAKAGNFFWIVFTSLKAGTDFEKDYAWKNQRKTGTLLYPLPRLSSRGSEKAENSGSFTPAQKRAKVAWAAQQKVIQKD